VDSARGLGRLLCDGMSAYSIEFICEECGKVCTSSWTDDEAQAEAHQLWGDVPDADLAIICDDCFQELMAWKSGHRPQ
jgi:hypothetical protein